MTEGKKARNSEEKYGRYIRKKLGEVRIIFAALKPFPSYISRQYLKSPIPWNLKQIDCRKIRGKGVKIGQNLREETNR